MLGLVYHTEMASIQLAEELTQGPSGPVQVPTPESAGQAPLCVACPRSGKNSDQRQAGVSSNLLDQLTGPEMRQQSAKSYEGQSSGTKQLDSVTCPPRAN